MSEDERVARGHRARAELQLTEEAFGAVRGQMIEEMLAETDPAKIMECHHAIAVIPRVQHALRLVVDDGLVAAELLDRS